jgi:hypothetical protein
VFEEKIAPLCKFLENELRDKLNKQDHIATGKLRESIKTTVEKTAKGYTIEGRSEFYGRFVDTGRKPGGKRVPISVLLSWIQVKGIPLNGKKAIDVAWAIQRKIYQNGIPTNGDKEKTGFITKTLGDNEGRIKGDIATALGNEFTVDLHNLIWDVQKRL